MVEVIGATPAAEAASPVLFLIGTMTNLEYESRTDLKSGHSRWRAVYSGLTLLVFLASVGYVRNEWYESRIRPDAYWIPIGVAIASSALAIADFVHRRRMLVFLLLLTANASGLGWLFVPMLWK